MTDKQDVQSAEKIPGTIGLDVVTLKPLLIKWRQLNIGVPWSALIRRGVKRELLPIAGKRHQHLLKDFQA